ncbi:SH3 domain-containing protein [Cupriavidus pampae]|uniref:SH3b domain-containing protein n=1 Tax=Cupriavidus pampae TaxID=659251 RepID=A0ABN7XT70_9BURK|nr:SH3 domain-containing protein [Cupriavidus pampae]CAG9164191.1 hypothetical protein LMG32289_00531 [Cupriavidus pampae]
MNSKITDLSIQTLLGSDLGAYRAETSLAHTATLQLRTQTEALRLAMGPTDAMRRFLGEMNLVSPVSDTLSSYHQLANEPLWHAQEAARSVSAAFAQQLESMKAAIRPATEVLASFSAHRATFNALLAPSNFAVNLQDLLRQRTGDAVFEQAQRLGRPYDELLRALEQFKEPASLAALHTFSDSIANATELACFEHLGVDLVDGEADSGLRQRAASAIQAITADAEAQPSLQAAVDQIIAAIKATKEPAVQKVLWLVLLPLFFMLLGAFLTPYADFHIKQLLEAKSKQGATKVVKEAAREAIGDVSVLRDYRFIGTKLLIVRSAPSARAPQLGQLRFGYLVRILQRNGDFTLISWRNTDSNVEIQGWVFSRYLRRFD